MTNQTTDLIEKLRGGPNGMVFSSIDQIDFDMKVSLLIDINMKRDRLTLSQDDKLLNQVKDVLLAGTRWIFNPTCQIFINSDTSQYVYDKKKLAQYIAKVGSFTFQEVDINNSFLEVTVPVSILMANIDDISDAVFIESRLIEIHTFMGKVRIK
jgi:hypothetical protein